jgi:hypothetical protein
LTPYIGSLVGASVVVLVSNTFKGVKKTIFQVGVFSTAGAISAVSIFNNPVVMGKLWDAFKELPIGAKFGLSMFSVASAYFGCGFYTAGLNLGIKELENQVDLLSTPASIDSNTGFDIPSTLPQDDTEFFQSMFHK